MNAPAPDAPPPAARGWPRLHPDESMRLRALALLSLLLLLPGGWHRLARTSPPAPGPRCAEGVVAVPAGLRCAPHPGAEAHGLAAWWMGAPLDLNRASARDLTVVRGIGPKLAARIVEDRAARGPFAAVDEVQRVRGVGPKLAGRLAAVVEVQRIDHTSSSSVGISNR